MKSILSLILLPLLASCGLAIDVPIKTTEFPASDKPATHLVILLSGRGAQEDYFIQQQWVPIAREHGVDVDFIAPYAHMGYYMRGQLTTRLYEDVIMPAMQKGYKTISIAGISMGGLGTLLTSRAFPELIDHIFLIAPFLGSKDAQDDILKAGGLVNWTIKDENKEDWNYFIWQRLKEITSDPVLKQKIYLGYGEQEKLGGMKLLADALPKGHVFTIPGEHKDVVFSKLWTIMNQRGILKY